MKSYIVVPLVLLVIVLAVVFFVDIPTINDLALDTDSTIYAGEGEACLTPYTQIQCQEHLECVLVSKKPQKNGVCLPKGTILEEDFINRNILPEEDQ